MKKLKIIYIQAYLLKKYLKPVFAREFVTVKKKKKKRCKLFTLEN